MVIGLDANHVSDVLFSPCLGRGPMCPDLLGWYKGLGALPPLMF